MNTLNAFRRLPLFVKMALGRKLDPLDMLQADHVKVESLFLQMNWQLSWHRRLDGRLKHSSASQARIFSQIKRALEQHAALEERVFYPACERIESLKDLVSEARVEHTQFRRLLDEMPDLTRDNETGDAKIRVLMEDVLHHVQEEEGKLFPRVRSDMSRTRLERLGEQMRAFQSGHGVIGAKVARGKTALKTKVKAA